MAKPNTRRNQRKSLLRRFESCFDLNRLDYKKRAAPGKDRAKITGIIVASIVYFAGYGLAYYSYSQQLIDDNFLNKMSWIFMVPASVVGLTTWLITGNRREFPIRQDIRAHIADFEGETGTVWRYEPVLNEIDLGKLDVEGLVEASTEGRLIKMAPEDVCALLKGLHIALSDSELKASAVDETEKKFVNNEQQAA